MKKTIKHRFTSHVIDPGTEILIIGTFNPEAEDNSADFFYGRPRNYLWQLLPAAFDHPSLKGATKQEKLDFIRKVKVDFIDLLKEVTVEEGKEADYRDGYLDKQVHVYHDVEEEISRLANLKKVCFTRISFGDIPRMKLKIQAVEKYCRDRGIEFQYLPTPARFSNAEKQQAWTNFLTSDN